MVETLSSYLNTRDEEEIEKSRQRQSQLIPDESLDSYFGGGDVTDDEIEEVEQELSVIDVSESQELTATTQIPEDQRSESHIDRITLPVANENTAVAKRVHTIPGYLRSEAQKKAIHELPPVDYWTALTEIAEYKKDAIPFNPERMAELAVDWYSVTRIQAHNRGEIVLTPEEIGDHVSNVVSYVNMAEYFEHRRITVGGKFALGATQLPKFVGEFIGTGGSVSAAKAALQKLVKESVKESAEQSMKKAVLEAVKQQAKGAIRKGVEKAAVGTAKLGAFSAAQTTLMPHNVMEHYFKRMLGDSFIFTEKGYDILDKSRANPNKALLGAFGDVWISNFSEGTGGAILGSVKKGVFTGANKILSERLRGAFVRVAQKMKPNQSVATLMTQAGIHSMFEEMTEEQVEKIIVAVTGMEEVGTSQNTPMLTRLTAQFDDPEEFLIELGLIGITRAGLHGTGTILGDAVGRTETPGNEGIELTEEQILEIVNMAEKKPQAAEAVPDATSSQVVEAPSQEGTVSAIPEEGTVPETEGDTLSAIPEEGTVPKTGDVQSAVPAQGEVSTAAPKLDPKKADKVVVEGRIAEVSKNADQILKDVQQLVKEEDTKREAGQSTKGIESRIQKKLEQYDKLDEELGGLLTNVNPHVKRDRKIRTTARKLLAVTQDAFKQGVKLTKAEIKQVQTVVKETIQQSDIPAKGKERLLSRIPNIQTSAQLQKALGKLQEDILNIQEQFRSDTLRTKINKVLKKAKKKLVARLPKGKFDADTQRVLDMAVAASKASFVESDNKIEENIAAIESGTLTPEEAAEKRIENEIYFNLSNLKNQSSEELEETLQTLETLVADGRLASAKKIEEARKRREGLRVQAQKSIEGDQPVDRTAKPLTKTKKQAHQLANTFGIGNAAWRDLLNVLSQHDKKSGSFGSLLNKAADVFENERNYNRDVRVKSLELSKLFYDNFDFAPKRLPNLAPQRRAERLFLQQLRSDLEVKPLGVYPDRAGGEVRLSLSKSQARTIWMLNQDKQIKESMLVEEGGVVIDGIRIDGLSQPMLDAVDQFLTDKDIQIAQGMLDFYKGYAPRFNEQYRDDFGVDLIKSGAINESYSPVSRQVHKQVVGSSVFEEAQFRRKSSTPKSAKSRVKNTEKIVIRPDFEVAQGYILEVEHYLNWGQKLKDLQAIFGDSGIRNLITKKFGKPILDLTDGFLQDFSKQAMGNKQTHQSALDWLRVNFTVANIALKEAIMVKQLVSFVSYAQYMPVKDFTAGVMDALANPKKVFDTLSKSDYMIDRANNHTRDFKDAMRSQEFADFRQFPNWKNAITFHVRWGDAAAIYLGGWSVYQKTLKETGSKEKAMQRFEELTDVTQQSGNVSQQSAWQRGGPLSKLFTMFLSAPRQQMSLEIAAIRDALQGRITVKQAAKVVAINHFIIPALIQWISDGFDFDEEEQLRAVTLGPFNSIAVFGDVLDAGVREVIKAGGGEIDTFGADSFGHAISRGIRDAMRELRAEDFSAEDVLGAFLSLVRGSGGPLTGIPINTIFNKFEGVGDLLEGEGRSGILKLLGWPPRAAESEKKGKRKLKR